MTTIPPDTTKLMTAILKEELRIILPPSRDLGFTFYLERFAQEVALYATVEAITVDQELYTRLADSLINGLKINPTEAIKIMESLSRKIGPRVSDLNLPSREELQLIRKISHQLMMLRMKLAQIGLMKA